MSAKASKGFWNLLAGKYDGRVMKKFEHAYAESVRMAGKYLEPTHSVLDFACGTGITTLDMAGQVNDITAIDISEKMIAVAQQKTFDMQVDNIDYEVCDLDESRLDGRRFDIVVAFNILHFLPRMDEAMERISELLKPSGICLAATDCMGRKRSWMTSVSALACRTGLLPYMKAITTGEFEDCFTRQGFSIIETAVLNEDPLNYFIAARNSISLPASKPYT